MTLALEEVKRMQNKDNWNARYVTLNEILYTCPVCFALVAEPLAHATWHEQNFVHLWEDNGRTQV